MMKGVRNHSWMMTTTDTFSAKRSEDSGNELDAWLLNLAHILYNHDVFVVEHFRCYGADDRCGRTHMRWCNW